ncbi:hypothetical protein J3A83DRAFT_4189827 [Scleroderma citrinum]
MYQLHAPDESTWRELGMTICFLVAKSADALVNPNLVFENVVHMKWLVTAVGYSGPVAVAGDCTKVCPQLAYSSDFEGHILGSTFPLDKCQILLPQYPPQVVALLPTKDDDNASSIYTQLMLLLNMAAQLGLPVITAAADGAACEVLAQHMMDQEASVSELFQYDYPLYGIHLCSPVLKTDPIVSITNPLHA